MIAPACRWRNSSIGFCATISRTSSANILHSKSMVIDNERGGRDLPERRRQATSGKAMGLKAIREVNETWVRSAFGGRVVTSQ